MSIGRVEVSGQHCIFLANAKKTIFCLGDVRGVKPQLCKNSLISSREGDPFPQSRRRQNQIQLAPLECLLDPHPCPGRSFARPHPIPDWFGVFAFSALHRLELVFNGIPHPLMSRGKRPEDG